MPSIRTTLLRFACAATALLTTAVFADPPQGPAEPFHLLPFQSRIRFRPDKKKETDKPAKPAKSAEAKKEQDETPQVEWFVPSLDQLAKAAKRSRTAQLYAALSSMAEMPEAQTDEEFDVDALLKLLTAIRNWPDTSLTARVFSPDAEGRPRWTLRVNWPIAQATQRVTQFVNDPAAKKILGNVEIKKLDGDRIQLSLADTLLAVLSPCKNGSLLASSSDMKLTACDLETAADDKADDTPLISCRYNIGAAPPDEEGNSAFGALTGVRDINFNAYVDEDGRWSERWKVGWNPLFGLVAKSAVNRVGKPFAQPRESLVLAAINAEPTSAMPDSMAGFPRATIAQYVSSEMAIAIEPGTGFLPVPDLFYQWNARSADKLLAAIRKAVDADSHKRRDDDRRIAWHEIDNDGQPAFWFDPGANEGGGMRPFVMRTVLFFDGKLKGDDAKPRLILAQTSTGASDVIKRWKELRRNASDSLVTPDNDRAHWQAVIHWKRIYNLMQPWLAVLAGLNEDAPLPPTAAELGNALCDSVIDIRIEFGGLSIEHTGPLPIGAAYVPGITAMALGQSVGWASESAREMTATENLRVLQHHAKLFHKDFKRWPATVAQLDGYIDFKSYPYLLQLQPRDRGFIAGLTRLAAKNKKKAAKTEEADDDAVDDSLYVIRGHDDATWNIAVRPNEFKRWDTIRIDAAGKIEKVKKSAILGLPLKTDGKKTKADSTAKTKKNAPSKPTKKSDSDDEESED